MERSQGGFDYSYFDPYVAGDRLKTTGIVSRIVLSLASAETSYRVETEADFCPPAGAGAPAH